MPIVCPIRSIRQGNRRQPRTRHLADTSGTLLRTPAIQRDTPAGRCRSAARRTRRRRPWQAIRRTARPIPLVSPDRSCFFLSTLVSMGATNHRAHTRSSPRVVLTVPIEQFRRAVPVVAVEKRSPFKRYAVSSRCQAVRNRQQVLRSMQHAVMSRAVRSRQLQ